MPLVKAQCTNCNGMLDVDSSKDAAICPHCGTPYVVEKAIQQFTVNNTNIIENATILNESEFQKLLGAAEGFYNLGKIADANNKYIQITKDYPQKFEGWWGIVQCSIKTELNKDKPNISDILSSEELENARKLAGEDQISLLDSELEKFKQKVDHGLESKKKTIKAQFETFTQFRDTLFSGGYYYTNNISPRYVLTSDSTGSGIILSSIFFDNDYPSAEVTRYSFDGWNNDYCFHISNVENVTFEYEYNKKDELINGSDGRIQHNISKTTKRQNWSTNSTFQLHEYNNPDEITIMISSTTLPSSGIVLAPGFKTASTNTRKITLKRCFNTSNQGCYIATCVYGSYDCPEVWTLRRFRDNTLAKYSLGKVFIKVYYSISPTLVKWLGKTKLFHCFWRGILDRFVKCLNEKGIEDTQYYD